ncbi:ABC transporter permease [Nocardioides marmoribigeumensis]|uniref:ABC transport system permease protein n=1 Tax=Nocardioides marmoribigeumensis TaxID=433649 RepID=A0ABU2BRN4_9ACTN|nr:ABC transporter permease [Nocardioides marmoribigeumensis]MDR7360644.1 putative ABC transport system permease protein [Nocardioides marmoribigeumensis]
MVALSTAPAADWRLAVVLLVLGVAAVLVSRAGRLPVAREQALAAVRAVLQLAAVSAVIALVLRSTPWSIGFVLLMFAVATFTATRRLGVPLDQLGWVGLAVAAGAAPVVVLVLATGVIPFNGPGLLPMSGILIGGAMTAATLTGRRALQELRAHVGTYEAARALGFSGPEAIRLVVEPSSGDGLMPGIDQTRTVGLVTLPGAYVGVLLGGGSAVDAGAAQILVLVGLLAVQASTAATLLRLVAVRRVLPLELGGLAR